MPNAISPNAIATTTTVETFSSLFSLNSPQFANKTHSPIGTSAGNASNFTWPSRTLPKFSTISKYRISVGNTA
jgi:hypothetical protein